MIGREMKKQGRTKTRVTAARIKEIVPDVVVQMSVNNDDAVIRGFLGRLGVTADADIEKILKKARQRIAEAANYDPKQELGRALMNNNDLYARAWESGDLSLAAGVLKDRTKVLGLDLIHRAEAEESEMAEDAARAFATLEAVRSILLSVKPNGQALPTDIPLEDAARLVVDDLIRARKQCLDARR
ncbi:MAG: hypothetical protein ACOX6D_02645 [Thermoguttaceae bacterium]|jgi:hypothetical protein